MQTKNRKDWSPEEKQLLRELCESGKYKAADMTAFFPGRARGSILGQIQYIKISNRYRNPPKYNYDRTFFDELTPESCYWAGIMLTDGHIGHYKDGGTYIRWGCAIKDKPHMELFKKLTKAEQPIKTIFPKCKISTSDPNKIHPFCYIAFESAKPWADALKRNFNFDQNKTLRAEPPVLPNMYLKLCFLRGLFDGDGCITRMTENSLLMSFCGCNKELVTWVQSTVSELNLPTLSHRPEQIYQVPNEGCYYWTKRGLTAAILYEILRRLSLPRLERKWDNPDMLKIIGYWKARSEWPPEMFFDLITKKPE